MIKKRYLIFVILILCIILSFHSIVYAGKWQNINDTTIEYSDCYETFNDAVQEAIMKVSTWQFIQSVAKDTNGDGYYDDKDIEAFGAGMQVGETRLYKYSNDSNGSYINSTGDLYEIYIERKENTTKSTGFLGLGGEKEVEQYKPTIKLVKENASVGTEIYAETYREFIARINKELGTYIPLPKENESLQDGDVVEFGNQKASNSKVYKITVKAKKVNYSTIGIEYIGYSYDYIDVTDDTKVNLPNKDTSLDSSTIEKSDLLENLDDYKPGEIGKEEAFSKKVGVILGILNIVGSLISVVTIILIGLKYMLGSVEEKASYKKVMIPWLIGAFLVFTVTTLPNILYNLGTSISNDTPKSNVESNYIDNPKGRPSEIYFDQIV